VCGGVLVRGEEWMKEIRGGYMVDGLHIPIWNRTKKPLAIAWSGGAQVERDVASVQYKPNQNCHDESPHPV
jgi:hypothetical protein